MLHSHAAINRFYRSSAWQQARLIKITNAHGRCEVCGGVGEEVHHVIHITPDNIHNVAITLNQDNLKLLCRECHNKEHNRFVKAKQSFDADGNLIGDDV